MKFNRRAFIAGGVSTPFIGKFNPDFIWKKHPDFGKKENPSLEDYINIPTNQLFDELGIDPALIDKAYVGNFAGQQFSHQGHLGAALAGANPALQHKPIMRTEGACASGGLAFTAALDALQAGYDILLIVGAEVQTSVNAKQGAEYLAGAAHYATQRDIDPFTFPALFARRAKALMEAGLVTESDLADVAVKAYANANKNPLAHMRAVNMTKEAAMTSPQFLSNEELNPFLRVSHCSQVSDGGSAMLLVSEAGAKKLGLNTNTMSEILSASYAAGSLYEETNPFVMDTVKAAAMGAYKDAGVNPGDIKVAEVHDCFAVTEILIYEALGFADQGKGAQLVRDGVTTLDGKLPVNTGGGLMAFGHPVGATGVKQLIELHKQLKGSAGDYQIKGDPDIALAANMGGDDRTAVVTVLKG